MKIRFVTVIAALLLMGVLMGVGELEELVGSAIAELQPAVTPDRQERLAWIITEAATKRDFDPLLITSMIMRESSFREEVERGDIRGRLDEIGLMQIHPAIAFRFAEDCNPVEDTRCNVKTGVRILDYKRDTCVDPAHPGSTWVYVASYGMSKCATYEQAKQDPATKRAKAYYDQVGGTEWVD
jgi:soluble lytic murein transglycosylase-like protein